MAGALERGWTQPTAPGYRIGTAERERVRDLLEGHTAEGRLTLDEFGERIDEVLRARTAVDLDHALRELPPAPSAGQRASLPRRLPPLAPVAFVLAAGLLVASVLAVVGALWPLWILLLVTRFALIGARRGGRGRGGPPWGGPSWGGPRRQGPRDDPWSSQTRWV